MYNLEAIARVQQDLPALNASLTLAVTQGLEKTFGGINFSAYELKVEVDIQINESTISPKIRLSSNINYPTPEQFMYLKFAERILQSLSAA